jgi:hypothetical protein
MRESKGRDFRCSNKKIKVVLKVDLERERQRQRDCGVVIG